MNEENLHDSSSEEVISAATAEPLSKSDAMAGVFTEPGDTFEQIAAGPKENYWIMPTLILIAAGLIATFIFFSNAELVSKVMSDRMEEAETKLDEEVKKGNLSREDADQRLEQTKELMDPTSIMFKAIGFGSSILMPFITLIVLAGVYMLGLKIMKSGVEFYNVLNVVGLGFLIIAIGTIIGTVVSVLMGDFKTLGLSLLVSSDSVGKKLYSFLAAFDIFAIWYYAVVSIGLSKVGKIKPVPAFGLVFGLWLLWHIVTSFFVAAAFG